MRVKILKSGGAGSVIALLSALALSGCTATIEGPATASLGPSAAGAEPTPPAGTPSSTSCAGLPARIDGSPLRRLSRLELDNTLRDVLGDDSHAALTLPSDDITLGFEVNASAPPSQLTIEGYQQLAEQLAAKVNLVGRLSCDVQSGTDACARSFIESLGRKVYRRQLESAETDALFQIYSEKRARSSFEAGVRLAIAALLQAPKFLYRVELGDAATGRRPVSGHELSTRLSYLLWQSAPDDALLDAAVTGQLDTAEQIAAQVRRMMKDARFDGGIRSFYRQWLKVVRLDAVDKDPKAFPEWNPALRDSMKEETLRFVSAIYGSDKPTLRSLLTSTETFVDQNLAAIYGLTPPADGSFTRVTLPSGQRAGILTQAGLLTVNSFANEASPIHRGLFVRTNLLCGTIPPPPANVVIKPPEVDPSLPTRARYEQHRTDPFCSSCHEMMDPIGFGFQHYDGLGRFTDQDGKFPVDARGELKHTRDADGPFDGALELAERLASSAEARQCLAQQWFRFALGRQENESEACLLGTLAAQSGSPDLNLATLAVDLATSDLVRVRASLGEAP